MKVLVTGASKGIGNALTKALVLAGYEVWGVARSEVLLIDLKKELGSQFHYTVADLSGAEGAKLVVDELLASEYCAERVYLNAGAYSTNDTTFRTAEHQETMINTNYVGPVALFEAMLVTKCQPKEVIVMSSLFAKLSDEQNPFYADAKRMLSEYFVQQAANTDLNVKVLYLGPVDTNINNNASKTSGLLIVSPRTAAKYLMELPLKRGVEHIFPFTSKVFYAIFSLMPQSVYNAFMKIARR